MTNQVRSSCSATAESLRMGMYAVYPLPFMRMDEFAPWLWLFLHLSSKTASKAKSLF
jgi:hypothetical protein